MTTIRQQAPAPGSGDLLGGRAEKGTIGYLLEAMQRGSDFPVLSESIRSLNQLTESKEQDVRGLASIIIGDFALTNKLLKVVNSAYYSSFSGKIGSISRAIVVLGTEAVRALAASLIFLEHLNDKSQASRLRDQISAAIFSATLARQLASALGLPNVEGSFLCGMLQSLGEILVTYYLPEEGANIERLIGRDAVTPESAQLKVLGMTFEQIGVAVARHWNFPGTITRGMRRCDPASAGDLKRDESRMRLIASFANEAASVIGGVGAQRAADESGPLADYLKLLKLKPGRFREIVSEARKEFGDLNGAFRNDRSQVQTPFVSRLIDAADRDPRGPGACGPESPVQLAVRDVGAELQSQGSPAQEPDSAAAELIMTEGLQEVSGILAGEGGALNQVFNVVLETLYRAMGFRHVLLCLNDGRRQRYAARLGFGVGIEAFMAGFSFPASYNPDVFHAALKNGSDIYIEDTGAGRIKADLPGWYLEISTAGSFIVLPVVLNRRPVGMIYADHEQPRGMLLSGNQLNLMKTLRNQVLLALRTRV